MSRGHVGRSGDSEAQGESADPQTFGWAGKQLRKTVKLLTSKHLPRHLKARMGPQRFLLPKRHKRGMIAGGHPLDRTLVAGVETAGVIRPGSGEPGRGARIGRTVPTHGVPEIREFPPETGTRRGLSTMPGLKGAVTEITAPTMVEADTQVRRLLPDPGLPLRHVDKEMKVGDRA